MRELLAPDRAANLGRTLLDTKLRVPLRRGNLVSRTTLVDILRWSSVPLVLVDAPAGWGKTTLLADWCVGGSRFAWLSLEEADNDPARFWTYLVEALRAVEPDVGGRALASLAAFGTSVTESVLPGLLNELATRPEPLVLVLDDYHLIVRPEIHDGTAFLIEHLPPTLRLVVATRVDPPLPLARMRARGELLEIRAGELRFSEEEAGRLLNHVLGLDLSAGDVARLWRRTEGWAAGLYLAALSLRGRNDRSAFIDVFAGDDRHVVDYLGAEVLDCQPAELRRFLVETSFLDRLCGPLCDAVTGRNGSARRLEEIERSNLFLVPLDNRRAWYRYHHLFADLLRQELRRHHPELLPILNQRAAAWCRDNGLVAEAIGYATAAGDFGDAGELIARHWLDFLEQGRPETIVGWVDALPAAAVDADARLWQARAGALLFVGRLDEVGRCLAAPPTSPPAGPLWHGLTSVDSGCEVVRACHSYLTGNLKDAIAAGRRALDMEGNGSPYWRAAICSVLGMAHYLRAEVPDAVEAITETLRVAEPAGSKLAAVIALGLRAAVCVNGGDVDTAEKTLARLGDLISRDEALGETWTLAWSQAATGMLLQRRGRLEAADAAFARAAELAGRGQARLEVAHALLGQAGVRHALGDVGTAGSLVARARHLVDACRDPGMLPTLVTQLERALRLAPPPPRPTAAGARREALSDRELAVLRLLPGPCSLREIGEALYVSHNTVKTHVRGLYRKLGASSRHEAVARARAAGLL